MVVFWFMPLRRRARFVGLACVQSLRAWAALDVCAFTVVGAWGFGPPFFRSFTQDPSQAFGPICSALHSTFGLETTPQSGLWIAISHAVLVFIASVAVCRQA